MRIPAISKSLIYGMVVAAVIVAERMVAQVLGTGGWSIDLTTGSGLGVLMVWGIGHCDGLDGPVVQLAIKALDSGARKDLPDRRRLPGNDPARPVN